MSRVEEISCKVYDCEAEDLQLAITLNPSLSLIRQIVQQYAKEKVEKVSEKSKQYMKLKHDYEYEKEIEEILKQIEHGE